MPILSFNKATNPLTPDDVRVNNMAVCLVETSRSEQLGQTIIYVLGQGAVGIPVTESLDAAIDAVGGLVAATRHYLAGQPTEGGSTVYIAPSNISYLRPNSPTAPTFWYVYFTDGVELRILDPLPPGL